MARIIAFSFVRELLAGACLLVFVAQSNTAAAQETIKWADVGDWTVYIDRTVAGCFTAGIFNGGTLFRIGLDSENQNGYLLVGNDAWRSLEVGKEYELVFQFGTADPWRGEGTAINMDGSTLIMVPFRNYDLLLEFMKKHNVSISYRGSQIDNLNLRGSYAAFLEVINCQAAIDGKGASSGSDPFSSGGASNANDPFAQ
ncbi:hypothetical protein [Dongia sp.]|uniref:hypothetical protein n=1 Tax=Dongia sp. TaxID=1977262 RepID=UPI0034A521DB